MVLWYARAELKAMLVCLRPACHPALADEGQVVAGCSGFSRGGFCRSPRISLRPPLGPIRKNQTHTVVAPERVVNRR